MQLARTEPVNLALRGVLYDLSLFEDYEDVLKNFQDGAEIPYIYKGKTYALPDTQGFNVMFVRDDILNELGIEIPKTWEEFLSATSIVQRKNMNSYLPYTRIISATTVNTGAGGLSIYPTMLLQNGERLYNEELNASNLASSLSVKTFKFGKKTLLELRIIIIGISINTEILMLIFIKDSGLVQFQSELQVIHNI